MSASRKVRVGHVKCGGTTRDVLIDGGTRSSKAAATLSSSHDRSTAPWAGSERSMSRTPCSSSWIVIAEMNISADTTPAAHAATPGLLCPIGPSEAPRQRSCRGRTSVELSWLARSRLPRHLELDVLDAGWLGEEIHDAVSTDQLLVCIEGEQDVAGRPRSVMYTGPFSAAFLAPLVSWLNSRLVICAIMRSL